METFILYIARASVYLLIFGLGYYLLLSGQNATPFKRFYILLSFMLSLGLAAIGQIPVALGINSQTQNVVVLPEILVQAGTGISEQAGWLTLFRELPAIWILIPILVMAFFMVGLLYKLLKLSGLLRQYPSEKIDDIRLVLLPRDHSPFSFFHWIFIPSDLRGSSHFQKVIIHERAHYLMHHSWDVMFMEVLKLLFWFHPMYYYLKRELQTLHEFEADGYALKAFSRADYQNALLDFAFGIHCLPITNPFNVSTIKKRFIMMNKTKNQSLKAQLISLFAILPFVVAVFAIQSCDFQQQTAESLEQEIILKEESVPEDDPVFTVVEVDPEFKGGVNELMKYLQNNLRYPATARQEGIQGTVFISFVVEKDGSISNAKILRGITGGAMLDAEALRVVNSMPEWKPGYQRGQEVRVQYNLPIRFVLN
jgi:TonB family protein